MDHLKDTEAAKVLRCSPSKLRNDRSQGQGLPYVKLGRLVFYRLADIQAAVDAARIVPKNNGARRTTALPDEAA